MKLTKLLPLTLMVSSSAIITPTIVSCSKQPGEFQIKFNYNYVYDSSWQPSIQPKAAEQNPITEEYVKNYLNDIKENNEIYANDMVNATFALPKTYEGEYQSVNVGYNILDVKPENKTISFECLFDAVCFVYDPQTSQYTTDTYNLKYYVKCLNMELTLVKNAKSGKTNVVSKLNALWEDPTKDKPTIVKQWQQNKNWEIKIVGQSKDGTERSVYNSSTMSSFLAFRIVSAYKTIAYVTDSNYLSNQTWGNNKK